MTAAERHSLFYDWGNVTTYTSDLRARELVLRVKWFITLRWAAVLLCGIGGGAAALGIIPAHVNPMYFAGVGLFLSISNLTYTALGHNLFGVDAKHRALRGLLAVQILTDFLSLSVLTYGCGGVETPLSALFLAHVILSTLFFTRPAAFAVVGAAWFFAVLPLFLEWTGLVPTVSIFDGGFKSNIVGSTKVAGGYMLGTGAVFFVCWYIVSSITNSLKLREHQLEDAYSTIVRLDEERTQSTLRATHELKAPFAAIKSYVYTLRDGYCGPLPEKAMAVVEKIGIRCDRLTRKIVDIIHLGNLKNLVVYETDFTRVNLCPILLEEIHEGELVGSARNISVVADFDTSKSYWIDGSASHLKTLFSNLIQNAVTYSRANEGKVTVSVSRTESPGRLHVTVRDNGIGIPPENLSKICDEHFRAGNAAKHNPEGSGLGLSIVKEVARLHGATMRVESFVDKGTSFTISFDNRSERERQTDGEHTHHR